jgi:hypothetical protein
MRTVILIFIALLLVHSKCRAQMNTPQQWAEIRRQREAEESRRRSDQQQSERRTKESTNTRSGSSSSTSNNSQEPTYRKPFNYTERNTPSVDSMYKALKEKNYTLFLSIYNDRKTEYNENAPSGGKASVGFTYIFDLSVLSIKDYSYLPLLYQAYYILKMGYQVPVFYNFDGNGFHFELDNDNYCINRSAIFVGNYREAINNFRRCDMYGKKGIYVKKSNEDYKEYLKAYNYINFMSGKCFEALDMQDSAKKYLKLGSGFEAEWEALLTQGKPYRNEKKYFDPEQPRRFMPFNNVQPFVEYVDACVAGNCKSGNGEKTWVNGDRYTGEFKNGQPHGQGVFYYHNGNIWRGDFKEGKINGNGEFTYANKFLYIGGMTDKGANGYGELFNSNGLYSYKGTWLNGEANGEGVFYSENGSIDYQGKFVEGYKENNQPVVTYPLENEYYEDLAVVGAKGKMGYIDRNRKEVIPLQFDFAQDFYEGMAAVSNGDKWGFIDRTGKVIIPIIYEEMGYRMFDGYVYVGRKGLYGIMDKTGKLIIDFLYESASTFEEGIAAVKKNGKYGYVNLKGEVVIPFMYDMVGSLYEGLRRVVINKKQGFINTKGETIIPLIYEEADDFYKGRSKVKLNGVSMIIDTKGNKVE